MIPLWLWYTIRNFSFFSFTSSNPAMANGGMYHISKMEIYRLLPPGSFPKTIRIDPKKKSNTEVLSLEFPLIAKPDYGLRGKGIQKLKSLNEWEEYHKNAVYPYLLQEYISLAKEAGIFYIRHPKESNGKITGIVIKEFMHIQGDGHHSLRELLEHNTRYRMQVKRLSEIWDLDKCTEKEVVYELEPIGNHNRGTIFWDGGSKNTEVLEKMINAYCSKIHGFFYGRIDLRFNSWEELEKGEAFQVIELNGALSESAHMYDPNHSYWNALKEIYRHHHLLFRSLGKIISAAILI